MKLVVKNYADPIKMFLTLPVELWDIIIEYYWIYHINHIVTISYNINDYEIFNSKQYKYRKLYIYHNRKSQRKFKSQLTRLGDKHKLPKLQRNYRPNWAKQNIIDHIKSIVNLNNTPYFKNEIYSKLLNIFNDMAKTTIITHHWGQPNENYIRI
tara:strand:+ start:1358 stop:1819 length:462 start_codon:yes stop_codon:yes gene_type:complete